MLIQNTITGSSAVEIGESIEAGPAHQYYRGSSYGVAFNDAGEGFLHHSTWVCAFTSDLHKNEGVAHGLAYCTFTDVDGDHIHTTSPSKGPHDGVDLVGMHTFIGGTGKYTGIEGTTSLRCTFAGQGQAMCTHEATYTLP